MTEESAAAVAKGMAATAAAVEEATVGGAEAASGEEPAT